MVLLGAGEQVARHSAELAEVIALVGDDHLLLARLIAGLVVDHDEDVLVEDVFDVRQLEVGGELTQYTVVGARAGFGVNTDAQQGVSQDAVAAVDVKVVNRQNDRQVEQGTGDILLAVPGHGPSAAPLAQGILQQLYPEDHIAAMEITLPWNRTFETEIDAALAPNVETSP